jgi:4,5-dihydroxyphthalate decarboxylase
MAPLPLTIACGPYDRTRALADGRVPVAGADVRYIPLEPEEIFFRMVAGGEFDVSEMSLATYLVTRERGAPFAAIPVFPSRMFRHSGVYVNTARVPQAIAGAPAAGAAAALAGKTVGLAEWQLTANVWIRGILADHYGVAVTSPEYRTGGLDSPGRREKVALSLPPQVRISPAGPGQTLSGLLAAGEIDAVYTPRAPECFGRAPGVARLFADARGEEERYFASTGIFPIMHVIVIHERVYEKNPWIARELMKAFSAAKDAACRELARDASPSVTLPFAHEEYEATVAAMGADYWAYGIEPNRRVLATFARYAAAQYLVSREFAPEELFVPEAGESFIV